ncbi:acylglycerol kinase, mitochondrial [Lucilia cuprina]|uniref:acylglycerol kinase, mitochondrial n=1 Tax=Lucilia cuprina TaxID=7375 RepID=UPI001F0699AC|nr:acylglycerol kinase, mitochondrial [Lucilia cuprina]
MEKFVQFTKTHWKKLSVVSIPVLYGVTYIRNEYQISRHMRYICNEVKQYSIPKATNILVVLNPVANKKRCEKMFKKYCEPILHMAGYSVEVIKTKHIGHAKLLMETLHQLPDVVVVAGGDGTSSEVVTGLLRRNEEVCPILFLPLGEKNCTASSLVHNESQGMFGSVKYLSQCVLSLIRCRIQYHPVIKYELIETDKSHEIRKPIFGLFAFSWGLLKDIDINKEKYWYFGALKHHVSVLMTSLSEKFNQNISANLVTTPPCPGCNKCDIQVKNKSWFNASKILNPALPTQQLNQMPKNKFCSKEESYKIDAKQIDITCHKNSDSFFELNTNVIENISSRSDFLRNMIKEMKIQPSISLESRSIELLPIGSEHQTYYIDGEGYDARHIKITFVPNALKLVF